MISFDSGMSSHLAEGMRIAFQHCLHPILQLLERESGVAPYKFQYLKLGYPLEMAVQLISHVQYSLLMCFSWTLLDHLVFL